MSIAFTEASDSIISTPCIQSPAAMYVGSQPVPRKCFDSEPQILPESAKKIAPLINEIPFLQLLFYRQKLQAPIRNDMIILPNNELHESLTHPHPPTPHTLLECG